MLINKEKRLIPAKKITVPVISIDDFIRLFMDYAADFDRFDESVLSDAIRNNAGHVGLDPYVFEEMVQNEYLDRDEVQVTSDEAMGNFQRILGVHQTTTGIPYLGFLGNSDHYMETFHICFYNENGTFEVYVPHYGNWWNLRTKNGININEPDDLDYCSQYGCDEDDIENASWEDLIDQDAVLEEIEIVFVAGNQLSNPTLAGNQTTNSTSGNVGNPAPQPKPQSPMAVFYELFSQKKVQLIPALQQTLQAQGFTTYDKDQCFKNLKDKNAFQKDIYNFILQYNCSDTVANQIIECTKIATYIKRFMYYHEGLIL